MRYERDNIKSMQGYVSGEQPEDRDFIKLNTNENPYPPAPEIQQVIADFDARALALYPPARADRFRDLAASLHKIRRDNIIATRGGDELLRLLITTFVNPGEAIGMTDPTYSLYPVLAQIQDCPTVTVPLEKDWTLPDDFAAQVNRAKCKLTFLVNPHAPSGKLLAVDRLADIASELNSVLLVDEAYVDFVEDRYDSIPLILEQDNIVILRTLSKGYSLAGLRFGYGIGAEDLITPMLEKTRDSYNLDLISQLLAEAAITSRDFAMENCRKIMIQRDVLRNALLQLGLDCEATQTNFLLATVPAGFACSARDLYEALKAAGILVRYFSEPKLINRVRISIGLPEENRKLVDSIKSLQGADRK
jgi:histidinol-phosphate aminotransferase